MNTNVAIMEFRQGAGGDEAKLWARELMRMYTRYANILGWKVEELDDTVIRIKGTDVFTKLQYEAGTHRVQRVPVTERQGRIHTSTATVAVLPEIPENEVQIRNEDLEWEFFRSGGKGGQNVNKVSSAVRLKHKPTGLVVTCQTERDQYQNRMYALSLLRAKLYELEEERKRLQLADIRSVIGRGLRSEKIRTYNFPQDRITDHRLHKSFRLTDIVEGKLDKLLSSF